MQKSINLKAFTIVELAIVLVVIGLILSMAVKGKALVNSAKLRAEMAKINKFEAAVSIWYAARNASLPEISGTADSINVRRNIIYPNVFINEGLLVSEDFEEKFTGNMNWSVWRCESEKSTSTPTIYSWYPPLTGYAKDICLTGAYPGAPIDAAPQGTVGVDLRLICHIETLKDDQNGNAGAGRAWDGTQNANQTTEINQHFTHGFVDCNDYNGTARYGYQLF